MNTYQTPLDRLQLGKCRGCGRDIVWAKTATGANLPLDVRPAGPHIYAVVVWDDGSSHAVRLEHVIDDRTISEIDARVPDRVFVSHWLTCPNPPRR